MSRGRFDEDLQDAREELKMQEGLVRTSAPVSGMGDVLNAIEGLNLAVPYKPTPERKWGPGAAFEAPEELSRIIKWSSLKFEAAGTVEASGQKVHVLVEITPPNEQAPEKV